MTSKFVMLNTSSLEVLSYVTALADEAKMRKTKDFQANMRIFLWERYKQILRATPPGVFEMFYRG